MSTTTRPSSNALMINAFMARSTAIASAAVTVVELLMSRARSANEYSPVFTALPEDFVEDNRVLFQLRKRLPYMAEAPQSLAYFEKVLTNKLVPKVQPQSYAVTV